eukprot:4994625-Amphidinium_carterae.1
MSPRGRVVSEQVSSYSSGQQLVPFRFRMRSAFEKYHETKSCSRKRIGATDFKQNRMVDCELGH